jgi:hypothetical protein
MILKKLKNLKLILSSFELLLDLQINFHKSVSGRPKTKMLSTQFFLAVSKANFQLGIGYSHLLSEPNKRRMNAENHMLKNEEQLKKGT